jgi:hypothetical protein
MPVFVEDRHFSFFCPAKITGAFMERIGYKREFIFLSI